MLGVTAVGYIVLFPNNFDSVLSYSFLSILVVALTVFSSYLFVRVIMKSRKNAREIEKAQQSELMQINRLQTLLNSISDPVLTLNRYGRITSQNAAAQAFFDMNQSLIGHAVDRLMQPKDGDGNTILVVDLISQVKTTSVRDDISVDFAGDIRHLSLQLSRIRSTFGDNEEYGVVLIIRDITKQKTLEEEKDEFISVTSHELRTPVAIAEGSLSNFLLMMDRHTDEKKLREAAEGAHEQVIYLAKMINDLSTLSRAERGVYDNPEPINVNNLLHELYGRYSSEANAKSLKLDLDIEPNIPEIQTSRLYLEEILQNFITNSIKYTKEGSVTIGAKSQAGGLVRFFVSDTGIGMSKTDLEHIFEKFYRSEDYRTRETSGTGLGLYVVRKLADKLSTKIEVESRLNHGSTFSFVLPVGMGSAETKTPEEAKQGAEAAATQPAA
jgi:two-component system sensor histidine kinase ResE